MDNDDIDTLDDRAAGLTGFYLLVGSFFRRALRAVEPAESRNRIAVGVRAVLDQLRRHSSMPVPQWYRRELSVRAGGLVGVPVKTL
ncbi:hypothetical protein [Pseudonocardia sp. HH130630-07]|uniref:hypothetical protein n=1 Tax=Pseudonocardia sp. HH130630-07 TaxID=1690815 RepID=UPI000814D0A3|nr:hypothetical protein [Pseudonocardia sp. HH130630-07]ANY08180.1 hypothetical protein AFB00_19980 [Pseudonocardia sp. HH130630-07]